MQAALDPMLAVSKGRLIEMSSPNGKRGHFYENWEHGVEVERIKIIGRECPRIGAEFLEKMRQKLGPMLFRQEFEGEFIDAESSAFSSEMIELSSPWSTISKGSFNDGAAASDLSGRASRARTAWYAVPRRGRPCRPAPNEAAGPF